MQIHEKNKEIKNMEIEIIIYLQFKYQTKILVIYTQLVVPLR